MRALLVTLALVATLAGSEFQLHPGLEWNEDPPPAIALAGRVQLLLFHESDEQADKWYGTLKKQISEAFDGDHRLVVIEIGVGDTTVVGGYGVRWLRANDPQRHVSRALLTPGGANRYLIVDGFGAVVARGDAKDHKPTPTGWLFHLAHTDLVQQHLASANPVVPDPGQQLEAVKDAARAASTGDLAGALKLAAKAGDAGRLYGATLLANLTGQVEQDAMVAQDAAVPGPRRFRAWQRLLSITAALGGSPPAKAAKGPLRDLANNEVLNAEATALAAWLKLNEHLDGMPDSKADERQMARTQGLQQIVERFGDTTAGDFARRGVEQR